MVASPPAASVSPSTRFSTPPTALAESSRQSSRASGKLRTSGGKAADSPTRQPRQLPRGRGSSHTFASRKPPQNPVERLKEEEVELLVQIEQGGEAKRQSNEAFLRAQKGHVAAVDAAKTAHVTLEASRAAAKRARQEAESTRTEAGKAAKAAADAAMVVERFGGESEAKALRAQAKQSAIDARAADKEMFKARNDHEQGIKAEKVIRATAARLKGVRMKAELDAASASSRAKAMAPVRAQAQRTATETVRKLAEDEEEAVRVRIEAKVLGKDSSEAIAAAEAAKMRERTASKVARAAEEEKKAADEAAAKLVAEAAAARERASACTDHLAFATSEAERLARAAKGASKAGKAVEQRYARAAAAGEQQARRAITAEANARAAAAEAELMAAAAVRSAGKVRALYNEKSSLLAARQAEAAEAETDTDEFEHAASEMELLYRRMQVELLQTRELQRETASKALAEADAKEEDDATVATKEAEAELARRQEEEAVERAARMQEEVAEMLENTKTTHLAADLARSTAASLKAQAEEAEVKLADAKVGAERAADVARVAEAAEAAAEAADRHVLEREALLDAAEAECTAAAEEEGRTGGAAAEAEARLEELFARRDSVRMELEMRLRLEGDTQRKFGELSVGGGAELTVASRCEISGEGLRRAALGQLATFHIVANDQYGSKQPWGGDVNRPIPQLSTRSPCSRPHGHSCILDPSVAALLHVFLIPVLLRRYRRSLCPSAVLARGNGCVPRWWTTPMATTPFPTSRPPLASARSQSRCWARHSTGLHSLV